MTWPPLEALPWAVGDEAAEAVAARRVRLFARYWDDCESDASNLEIIGFWLDEAERRARHAAGKPPAGR